MHIICKVEEITIDVSKWFALQVFRFKVCSAIWVTFRTKSTYGYFLPEP